MIKKLKCFIGLHKWSSFGKARKCRFCKREETSRTIQMWSKRNKFDEYMDFHMIKDITD